MRLVQAAAVSAVLLLPACGWYSYEHSSPDAIARDVAVAMDDVRSVRIEGRVNGAGAAVHFEASIARNGNCRGTVVVKGQGRTKVLASRGELFIKPDEPSWRGRVGPRADAVIGRVGDHWVATKARQAPEAAICEWGGFDAVEVEDDVGFAFLTDTEHDLTEVVGRGELNGQETVRVEFEYRENVMGEAHVLADDPHYLVGLTVEGQEFFTLSDYNKPVRTKAPKNAVDFDALR